MAATLRLTSTYAYRERKGLHNAFRVGEGLVGQCAYEKDRILITDVPDDYIRIGSGLGEAIPMSIVVLPVIFEGEVKAVIELASFHTLQGDPPQPARPDHRDDRDRAEHDRGQHAHRVAAEAVAVAGRRADDPAGRAEGDEHPAGEAGRDAPGVGGAAQAAAGRAEAGQRGAGDQGGPAHHAEDPGRGEEPRDRAGQAGPPGEGRAARADVEVQVRVPRQHVARAADPAQQPADPLGDARGQRPGEPDGQAGGVRQDDLRGGLRPALADQRHPGHGQDRVGDDGDRGRRYSSSPSSATTSSARSARWPRPRAWS